MYSIKDLGYCYFELLILSTVHELEFPFHVLYQRVELLLSLATVLQHKPQQDEIYDVNLICYLK
jgi:hypothetical protein